MDYISSSTTFAAIETSATTITRTPDSDTETQPPPSPPQPKRVPYSRHHAPPIVAVVFYKECLKNHAASIGGHALDGCCEFLPSPPVNPSDLTSLKCAACGCHRNFHRRDPDDPIPLHHQHPAARSTHSPLSALQMQLFPINGHGGTLKNPSRPSNETNPTAGVRTGNNQYIHINLHSQNLKKRSRTKFSQEQKEKMYEFSEKLGWKLKNGENKLIEEFCKEIGVGRGVFKVWMHNNKHSSSRLMREKESDLLHHLSNGGVISNNHGSCGGVVHQFCANGSKEQETR